MSTVPTADRSAPATTGSRSLRRRSRTQRQAGYVMATTALLLIPMMIFAAFAVDVGAWYVRGQQIQRAADAAALAAVVWMPDEARARAAALEVTAINGFTDQPGDFDDPTAALPQVKVSRVGPQQVRVDIRAEGEVYFGSVLENFDEVEISRFATSEYVLPVEFGSPTNVIGYGDQLLDGEKVNAWTGMMGYCQPAHYGDVRAAYYIHQSGCIEGWNSLKNPFSTNKPTGISNPATDTNPLHDPEGYFFVVDVPEGRAIGTEVHLYDAGYCTTRGTKPTGDSRDTHLTYTLWDATDTPLDDSDIVKIGSTYVPGAGVGCNAWIHPPGFSIPSGDENAGRWYVQVQNDENVYGGFADGVNYFSVSARDTGAAASTCFTFDDATCVGVYARDRLPVRTQTDGDVATFYLANIEPVHEGKFLEVQMWDLGEGMEYVQFLNPQGDPVEFTWETDDTNMAIFGAGEKNNETCTFNTVVTGATEPCLNVGINSVQPKLSIWNPHWRFNGRWVTARIPLTGIPTDLTDYWWQIRYVKKPTGTSVDWTTWSTRVVGDPVRLIE